MTQPDLEQALRDLPTTGTLLSCDPRREVWRFTSDDHPAHLHFYPSDPTPFSRPACGARPRYRDPAMREFTHLQWLQKSNIPAPRAIAVMKGFRLGNRTGDAVILTAIESSTPLDRALNDADLAATPLPHRRDLLHQLVKILEALAESALRHTDLTLGSFSVNNDKLYLTDASHLERGNLKLTDLLRLGHSASRYATRSEIIRVWRDVGPVATALPDRNPLSPKLWSRTTRRSAGNNPHFATIESAGWTGHAFRRWDSPFPWSALSPLTFDPAELARFWADILPRLERHDLEYLKRSESGDIATTRATFAGRDLDLVIKIPLRKQWHRYLTDPLRGDRASRAWTRAWELIARDIPTAWPLIVMRRTAAGYPLQSAIVFERVPGTTLTQVDLNSMTPADRDTLFRRVGRLLRRVDDTGYYHRDAKSDNVIVTPDNRPVLVDLDGIRSLTFGRWSLPRMLRSMKLHPQYTPADSLSLCRGYAPFAHVQKEDAAR